MKDLKRIERILKLIKKAWEKNPNLRLCQLIGNCFNEGDLYDVEDELLEVCLIETYLDIKTDDDIRNAIGLNDNIV